MTHVDAVKEIILGLCYGCMHDTNPLHELVVVDWWGTYVENVYDFIIALQ